MLNFKKFKQTQDSEMDYRISERIISGRLTKCRYKLIDRFCRKNSFRTHCGHEWDCCGCLCDQTMSFEYKHNAVIIKVKQSFNY